jgi:hypothetical protein
MELSKTIALTAILFVIILILTSGRSLGQNSPRPASTPPKANEATFQRSSQAAPRPAGTERAPTKKKKTAQAEASPCVYKPVMTERDMAACRAARRK